VSETVYKLQPNRTLQLRGFDDRGAAAALTRATETGFTISGVFRDPADFCVLMLWDADCFFEHPRLKHLPDFDFAGMVLSFDASYSGLQPLDSVKFPTIDNTFLDVVTAAGATVKVPLFDHATLVEGGSSSTSFGTARASFDVVDGGMVAGDSLALWYLNIAWEYSVPALPGTASDVAAAIAALVNGTSWSAIGPSLAVRARAVNAAVEVTAARYGTVDTAGAAVTLASGMGFQGLRAGDTLLIAGVERTVLSVESARSLTLTEDPGNLTGAAYLADRGGVDGNHITLYTTHSSARLTASRDVLPLAGGSGATWRVELDFTALGIDQVRQMWLTFAPELAAGAAYPDTEFAAVFSNWSVYDPQGKRALKVAGPGSVRIEESDSWCTYAGASWRTMYSNWALFQPADGFFSKGRVRRASTVGDRVVVRYACDHVHDLYIGTSLQTDRGAWGVSLDGDGETRLDMYLNQAAGLAAVTARRLVRSQVAAGQHTVTLTVRAPNAASSGSYCYFDFVEAAVASDVPAALPARPEVSPAVDYDTDHGYKVPPARLMWWMDQLGFAAPLNVYVGVFWWNQRRRSGAALAQLRLDFTGTWLAGQQVFLAIGAPDLSTSTTIGKTVFAGETSEGIARALAYFINATFTGVWAAAEGARLTVTVRSPNAAYRFGHAVAIEGTADLADPGRVIETGNLLDNTAGLWVVDPAQSPALNRAARDWLADLCAECAARGREVTLAYSMELLNPPDDPPAGEVWAARFPDGTAVQTATGFATNVTTHCSFVSKMLAYQQRVFRETADLQAAAGLPVVLQCGEFLWWFFAGGMAPRGMAYYDAETQAAAALALGRPLFVFSTPNDDLAGHAADVSFLRSRLIDHLRLIRSYVRMFHPSAEIEILLPLDVNYPEVYGPFDLGGRLNYAVNIPDEFRDPATAPFDRVKMEGLDFGAGSRDLNRARRGARFPFAEGSWPRSKCRYLIAVFNAGCPRELEELQTRAQGIGYHFWAHDHVHLFGWDPRLPAIAPGADLE
jgi:hypothetical protein